MSGPQATAYRPLDHWTEIRLEQRHLERRVVHGVLPSSPHCFYFEWIIVHRPPLCHRSLQRPRPESSSHLQG